jgi:hypothetical protein
VLEARESLFMFGNQEKLLHFGERGYIHLLVLESQEVYLLCF